LHELKRVDLPVGRIDAHPAHAALSARMNKVTETMQEGILNSLG
jgi:hypothetical protein